jgi:hypothetical protein
MQDDNLLELYDASLAARGYRFVLDEWKMRCKVNTEN